MSHSDLEQMRETMRAPWTTGDFGALSKALGRPAADEFSSGLHMAERARVLDIACGTGAVTLPLSRRGAIVTGIDLAPNLLAQARAEAAREGVDVRFDEGFAEELPYPDQSFDVVVSMFGIAFSPFPDTVVAEMRRVLRPGGRLALGNWTEASANMRMRDVAGRYAPPPRSGGPSPVDWGEEAWVRARLGDAFRDIETSVVPLRWETETGPAATSAFFLEHAGPLRLLVGRLDDEARAGLRRDLERWWAEHNEAADAEHRTVIRNEYLRVTATRR